MFEKFKKIRKCEKGFTLTEVMIGMMILTIAIVTATNLVVGLIRSNQNNVKTLQAYYFAVEGIEAVRNIRDTNWIHNKYWLGDESGNPWGSNFEVDGQYSIDFVNVSSIPAEKEIGNFSELNAYAPWEVSADGDEVNFVERDASGFNRTISFYEYECDERDCGDYVRVQSKVTWKDGARDREVVVEEIFTNWKGGAI
ncbi:prepilin-type N-terminal cleavage/methylation domain-containing protein [Candidatus Peregrinibacteria bacterium]|nr:prepilin-type N-terminal cleavage/methylation domain-containing protein [Candidatus Peregrinibacteria bacterium]